MLPFAFSFSSLLLKKFLMSRDFFSANKGILFSVKNVAFPFSEKPHDYKNHHDHKINQTKLETKTKTFLDPLSYFLNVLVGNFYPYFLTRC